MNILETCNFDEILDSWKSIEYFELGQDYKKAEEALKKMTCFDKRR